MLDRRVLKCSVVIEVRDVLLNISVLVCKFFDKCYDVFLEHHKHRHFGVFSRTL